VKLDVRRKVDVIHSTISNLRHYVLLTFAG
jgi:hypothetical protein